MNSVQFLNKLVDSLPLLRVIAEMSASTVDDWLVSLGETLVDDPDLVEELASWLSLLPGFDEKAPPEKLKHMEFSLFQLRDALRNV